MADPDFRRPLAAKRLRWRCSESRFPKDASAAPAPLTTTIGQEAALEALRLGLTLTGPGYNVYVAGLPGVGKASLVQGLLMELTAHCALPHDRAYVNDFRHPEKPRLLELPRGQGVAFVRAMDRAGEQLAEGIRRLGEDEAYAKRREELGARFREQERLLLDTFEKRCVDAGFTPGSVQSGAVTEPDVFFVVGDQAVGMNDLDVALRGGQVKAEDESRIRATHLTLRSEMTAMLRKTRTLALERQRHFETLEEEVARRLLDESSAEIESRFPYACVAAHVVAARARFISRFPVYARGLLEAAEASGGRPDSYRLAAEEVLREFRVNLLLEPDPSSACPVIVENQPTWTNLFGQIEREVDANGAVRTDFLMIRPGSLLRADGGYLVLQATDVVQEEGVWPELKRVLKYGTLEIRMPEAQAQASPTVLRPDPIPVNVKVVLIGDEATWYALREADPEFAEIFKVKSTFERDTPLTDAALDRYAAFLRKTAREEGRLPIAPSGLSVLAEEGVREAGRQGRISVRFGRLLDLVREADHAAKAAGAGAIGAEHVRGAWVAAKRRHGVEERRVREAIRDGLILVQTTGSEVGQVNGLAVYDFGEHRFGKVARITAAVGAGQAGVVNVERLADLSGSSHDKGVLILGGWLRQTFGADRPAAFTASLVFEQSYGGVDGDSATCAEAFAILSALSRAPVRQGLAVTGSMNQHGAVQAVGGVNDKIEGFFDVCVERGLTGTQGVIIPLANVSDLMLREDVVLACAAGRFSVHAIDRVEQGIELLTGQRAGRADEAGHYPKGTLYADVAKRIARLSETGAPVVPAAPAARARTAAGAPSPAREGAPRPTRGRRAR